MQSFESSRLLTEKCAARIHLAVLRKTKSALELSDELGIPIATCYRKIRMLEDAGILICVERRLTRDGKRIDLFRSILRDVQVVFEKSRFQAKIELFDGTIQTVMYDMDLPSFWQAKRQTV